MKCGYYIKTYLLKPTTLLVFIFLCVLTANAQDISVTEFYLDEKDLGYKLTGVDGIAFSPEYTYFSYQGQTKDFKLYFQALPKNVSSFDFIESSSSPWKIFGIRIQ